MGFFKSVIKRVGSFAHKIVKNVAPHVIHGLRDFSSVAGSLGDIGNRLLTSHGQPSIGENIRKGFDVAGRLAGSASMAGHYMHYGNMGMPKG